MRKRRGKKLKKAYVDVRLRRPHVTSTLTVWLLYVLTELENMAEILEELEIELLPLTVSVLKRAARLAKPRDFEDRIHLATMLEHGIRVILSNDSGFDEAGVESILKSNLKEATFRSARREPL